MNFSILYLAIFTFIGLTAISLFLRLRKNDSKHLIRMKRNRFDRILGYVKDNFDEAEYNGLFREAGFFISILHYQVIRYLTVIGYVMLKLFMNHIKDNPIMTTKGILVLFLIFIVTSPRKSFLNKKTPFFYVLESFTNSYKSKQNIEIYRAISQLKNIAIAKQESTPSSDFILDQIRKFSKTTRPIFNRVMSLWTMGKQDLACDYLEQSLKSKEAEELSNILRKLDYIPPIELRNQILLVQENIRRERETRKIKMNENKGNVIFFVVASTGIVIMINFVVVVYYLETINQLRFIN